jgi:hypothetical protein
MPEDNQDTQPGTPTSTQPAEAQNADNNQQPEDKPILIPKDRFDKVNEERKSALAQLKAAEDARRQAEESALKEQGQYKELYEKMMTDAQRAQQELRTLKYDSMRREVAQTGGYPALWDRLRGDTDAELADDLARMVEAFPKPKSPNIDAGTGSGARQGEAKVKTSMSSDEREYWATMLGVRVQDLPADLVVSI